MHAVFSQSVASSEPTHAATRASVNWQVNLAEIRRLQPRIAASVHALPGNVEWVLARDGFLSAIDSAGNWWAGCSVPLRSTAVMLRKMNVAGTVACLLNPEHAGHVRGTLSRLSQDQGIITVVPDLDVLAMILACEDFSRDLRRHRLWFAAGERWASELEHLFEANPGLSTPTQFVRLKTSSEATVESMVSGAQTIFTSQTARRTDRLRAILSAEVSETSLRPRVCVIAPSRFQLWNDAGQVLGDVLSRASVGEIVAYASDDPNRSSPLGLAIAAAGCDVVAAADVGRADLPAVASPRRAWVTWITRPRVPAFDPAAPRDAIILADEQWKSLATSAGWPVERIGVAGWPAERFSQPATNSLAMIVDTRAVDTPESLEQFSSHRLLWELIGGELAKDPFAMGEDVTGYLNSRMRKLEIGQEQFDRRAFVEDLMLPAYAQGVARFLVAGGIELRLFGNGWSEIEEFRPHAVGKIESRGALLSAATESIGLVHCWPVRGSHAIESLGRPVLRTNRRATLLNDARAVLGGRQHISANAGENLADIFTRMAIIPSR